jgi:hypothetical protein
MLATAHVVRGKVGVWAAATEAAAVAAEVAAEAEAAVAMADALACCARDNKYCTADTEELYS